MNDLKSRLANWNIDNTPEFDVTGVYYGKIVKVTDGDTISVAFFLRSQDETPVRISCRMYGYDTPESRTKDDNEKIEGKRCTEAVRAHVPLDRYVIVEFIKDKDDKYGRGLAKIHAKLSGSFGKVAGYKVPFTEDCEPGDVEKIGKDKSIVCINDWCADNIICTKGYYGKKKPSFIEMMILWHERCKQEGKIESCRCYQCVDKDTLEEYRATYLAKKKTVKKKKIEEPAKPRKSRKKKMESDDDLDFAEDDRIRN